MINTVDTLPAFPWLSLLVFLPLSGALLCLLHTRSERDCRWLGLTVAVASFGIAIWLFLSQQPDASGWFCVEDVEWIGRFSIRYNLAMDGIALVMVLLTTFLQIISMLLAWPVRRHVGLFFALLLILESGLLGIFLAQDLILFYVFWEVALIPMFFLIGIWGHNRRHEAALKFFLYTLAGSLFMLLAIIGLYVIHGDQTGHYSFLISDLARTDLTLRQEYLLLGGFLAAFAIKSPLVPFHTWLPDALSEAPAVGSLDLTGLLIKTGVYGLIRIAFPLFPNATSECLPIFGTFALVALFHAGWCAYHQDDIKRLLAYSSISHLGLVVLGLAAWTFTAWQGSLLLMVSHGITTGALLAMVAMIRQRIATRNLQKLSGLWAQAPCLSALFLLFALASLGLPGLANFSGEILVLIGTFQTRPTWAIMGIAGVVFAAAYMLRLIQRVLWGEPTQAEVADLSPREWLILIPLAILTVWLGIYPTTFLKPLETPVLLALGGLP